MPNPLYNQQMQQLPGGLQNMLNAFQQFKGTFTGDPEKQVQALLNSGRMSQQQYNQLSQMAQSLMQFFK